jgi:transposase-like protein
VFTVMTCAALTAAPPIGKLRRTPKDGHYRGKQTYRCRECQHRFTPDGNRHCFPEAVKRQALDMYAEGTGITATGRVLGVQPATAFSWVKKAPQAC